VNGHAQVIRERPETVNGDCIGVRHIYGEYTTRFKRSEESAKQPPHIRYVLHTMRAHNVVVTVRTVFKDLDRTVVNPNS
jgi:hypothetical protein